MAPTAAMLLVWYHPWKPTSDSPPSSDSSSSSSFFRMNVSGHGLLDRVTRRAESKVVDKAEDSDDSSLEKKFKQALGKPTSDSPPSSDSSSSSSFFRMNVSGHGLLDRVTRRAESKVVDKAEDSDDSSIEKKFKQALELSCWSL